MGWMDFVGGSARAKNRIGPARVVRKGSLCTTIVYHVLKRENWKGMCPWEPWNCQLSNY